MNDEIKVKCGHCKHRLPKKICGCPESPRYNQQIGMGESCEFFLHNPAQPLYSKALAMLVVAERDEKGERDEKQVSKMIEALDNAIKLGLPEDDEVFARFTLGQLKFERVCKQLPESTDSPEFLHGLQQMEKAVLTDSQGKYGMFSEPHYRWQLSSLAAAYGMVKNSIWQQKGINQAIAYLEEKLHLFDYLSAPPLLLLLALGELYMDKRDTELARQTFGKILEVPVTPADECEADVRESAKHQLKALDSQVAKRSGCFIATAVYGGSDTDEIAVLRQFRDNSLVTRPIGKLFVSFYYAFSPSVAKLLERSEVSRKIVKRFLLCPVLAVVKHAICKTNKSRNGLLEDNEEQHLDVPISEMKVNRKRD
jgi:hypothetical protein